MASSLHYVVGLFEYVWVYLDKKNVTAQLLSDQKYELVLKTNNFKVTISYFRSRFVFHYPVIVLGAAIIKEYDMYFI